MPEKRAQEVEFLRSDNLVMNVTQQDGIWVDWEQVAYPLAANGDRRRRTSGSPQDSASFGPECKMQ